MSEQGPVFEIEIRTDELPKLKPTIRHCSHAADAQQQPRPGRAEQQRRVEEIRAREQAATPGPWEPCLGSGVIMMTGIHAYVGDNGQSVMIADCSPDEWGEHGARDHRPDLNFIVASRADIPWLLDRLQAAEERAAAAERERDALFESWMRWGQVIRIVVDLAHKRAHRKIERLTRDALGGVLEENEDYRAVYPTKRALAAAQPATGDDARQRQDGGRFREGIHV